jgi:hypothetical protein
MSNYKREREINHKGEVEPNLRFWWFIFLFPPFSLIVPAVYDGLAGRIRALRSKDQGRQTVPEQRRGNGAQRNDLAVAEAEPPTGPVCPAGQKSTSSPVMRSTAVHYFLFYFSVLSNNNRIVLFFNLFQNISRMGLYIGNWFNIFD